MSEPDPPTPGGNAPPVTMRGAAGVADHNSDIFFAAVETTRMPMILTDPKQPDNPIVFANRAFVKLTGYQPEEMVGRNCRFLQGPDTDRETISEVRAKIASRTDVSVELLNYRKDGTSFWNALFVSPVYDKAGELVYFFASQLDVSRRRDTESALRQAQKMEAVGQLTGGIAHDFNNLLQVIGGYAESLKRRVEDLPDPKIRQYVAAIGAASLRASTLTQQLLAFSRKQRLEGRVVNLNQLVAGMSDMADRTLGDAIEVRYVLEPDLWNTRIDPSQAETSLLNIMINARDAMPDGGRIAIRTANVRIRPDERHGYGLMPGDYVSVAVTDNGAGIDPAILSRVMEPFFTTKEEGKGTGLGLAMVYGFAKQSGGLANIYSEVGKGTTVRLFFPASDMQDRSAEARSRLAMDRGGTERILVVDDRVDVSDLAKLMLEDMGYTVEVAHNGAEALSTMATSQPFAMIFSDVIMPGGMNGYALARAARRRTPGIKILLATGYADAALDSAEESEEFEVITKPYLQADLARRVRLLLDGPTGVS